MNGNDIRSKVVEFHLAMDVPILASPTVPEENRVKLRARLIAEEFFEVLEALYEAHTPDLDEARRAVGRLIENNPTSVEIIDLADGLCDLDYVVEGTRLEFGIDGRGILDEVHAANMRKTDGPKRADGKRLKPEGWTPPDIERLLRAQGWQDPLAESLKSQPKNETEG
jgi:predicted HAD superfamily Cof-like phosphohydrolase